MVQLKEDDNSEQDLDPNRRRPPTTQPTPTVPNLETMDAIRPSPITSGLASLALCLSTPNKLTEMSLSRIFGRYPLHSCSHTPLGEQTTHFFEYSLRVCDDLGHSLWNPSATQRRFILAIEPPKRVTCPCYEVYCIPFSLRYHVSLVRSPPSPQSTVLDDPSGCLQMLFLFQETQDSVCHLAVYTIHTPYRNTSAPPPPLLSSNSPFPANLNLMRLMSSCIQTNPSTGDVGVEAAAPALGSVMMDRGMNGP